MTSDREAFIAGIRANPDDDLRRLVFADWLEERGEPERAEFIRLQIEAAQQYPPFSNTLYDQRARELLEAHAAEWFGPLFRDLMPDWAGQFSSFCVGAETGCSVKPKLAMGTSNSLYIWVQRGFGESLYLDLTQQPGKRNLGAALNHEPITKLSIQLGDSTNDWKRFTEPELRHIQKLYVSERAQRATVPTAVLQIFSDSHLAGVREFEYCYRRNDESQTLPVATVAAFECSPLGYRVNGLSLHLDDAGLRVLARSSWLQLEKLTVSGHLTSVGVLALSQAKFAQTLRSLQLDADLNDEAVAMLARASVFHKLVELHLSDNQITDSGLWAFSAARFLPQLEVLNLSYNPIEIQTHPAGLSAVAHALNPDTLRELQFCGNGYDQIPPCLAHLGDRVKV